MGYLSSLFKLNGNMKLRELSRGTTPGWLMAFPFQSFLPSIIVFSCPLYGSISLNLFCFDSDIGENNVYKTKIIHLYANNITTLWNYLRKIIYLTVPKICLPQCWLTFDGKKNQLNSLSCFHDTFHLSFIYILINVNICSYWILIAINCIVYGVDFLAVHIAGIFSWILQIVRYRK